MTYDDDHKLIELGEDDFLTYSVSHAESGDEVKGGFISEADAFEWLESACKSGELDPPSLSAYVVEKNEND